MFTTWVKAFIAFFGPIGATLATVAIDPNVTAAVPPGVLGGVSVVAGAITSAVAYATRNKQTAESIDTAIAKGDISLRDLEDLYDKYKDKLPGSGDHAR